MYRSLNIDSLGITGRQSELIELALSYRFKGLELDMEGYARHVETKGIEHANRCIESAKKTTVGLNIDVWEIPVDWNADEETIKTQITKIPALANAAKTIDATRCVTIVKPGSNTLALKDNFEFYAAKLNEIGELLAPHGVSLAVGFQAAATARADYEFEFVHTAETLQTLLSMVSAPNVGLYLDTWNWHLGGGTIDQVVALGMDKLVAVSVADIPADATADSIETNQRLLPGPAGVIPHADLLNKLHELEFTGPVASVPHVSQYKGITRDKLVAKVAEALRSVWPGADLLLEAETEAAERGEVHEPKEPEAEPAAEDAKADDAKADGDAEAKPAEDAKTDGEAEVKPAV